MSRWSERWDDKQAGLGNTLLSHQRRNQFMSVITKAERGYGKSMYNLQSIAYCYYHLGYTESEAWTKALDCFIFNPMQLKNLVTHALNSDEQIPFLCIDDARVHFSNKIWFVNLYTSMQLEALFDTIREAVTCLLINAPSKKGLLGALQGYDDHEITIYMDDGGAFNRKAVCIKWYSLPDGHRKYRKQFDDQFSCYVPDWVYNLYQPLRRQYLSEVVERLEELERKHKKRKGMLTTSSNGDQHYQYDNDRDDEDSETH